MIKSQQATTFAIEDSYYCPECGTTADVHRTVDFSAGDPLTIVNFPVTDNASSGA